MKLELDVIKELIESIEKSNIGALKLETQEFKLSIEKNQEAPAALQTTSVAAAVTETQSVQAENQTLKAHEEANSGKILKAPIVGTFYSAAAPSKPSFVKAGQQVKKGEVVYIIESMKLMNEITSEFDGTVAEILVKNGQSVEYGQPIMRLD